MRLVALYVHASKLDHTSTLRGLYFSLCQDRVHISDLRDTVILRGLGSLLAQTKIWKCCNLVVVVSAYQLILSWISLFFIIDRL